MTLIHPLEGRRLCSADPVAVPLLTVDPAATPAGTTVTGLTPGEVKTAYGLGSSFSFSTPKGNVTANGSGQTIAVVDAYNDPDATADLRAFSTEFGLAAPSLTVVNQTGSTTNLPVNSGAWGQEISLDLEWAHAIAPAAKLLLVETRSAGIADLMAGVDYARHVSGVSAVSMSWGTGEFSGETAYDATLATPSGHAGVTLVAAAGDGGTAGGPIYPAASGRVLSVGGTTLTTTGTYAYSSESTWSDTGGGTSKYEGRPAFQNGVQSSSYRTVPDVSYDANPNTGFAVYDSYSYQGVSGWIKVGGTSAAAPQWAALIAVADQGRSLAGRAALFGTTNALPALYAAYSTSSYHGDFHDVTSGSSGSISATTGYDRVTGLGTPDDQAILNALVKTTLYTPVSSASVPNAVAAAVTAPATVVAADVLAAAFAPPVAADAPSYAAGAAPSVVVNAGPSVGPAGPSLVIVPPAALAAGATTYAPGVSSPPPVTGPFAGDDVATVADAVPVGTSAEVLGLTTSPAPALTPFTLNLVSGPLAPVAAASGASFAAALAASTHVWSPVVAVAAAGAAVAWLATAPARDRRQGQAATSPFGDVVIGLVPVRA